MWFCVHRISVGKDSLEHSIDTGSCYGDKSICFYIYCIRVLLSSILLYSSTLDQKQTGSVGTDHVNFGRKHIFELNYRIRDSSQPVPIIL